MRASIISHAQDTQHKGKCATQKRVEQIWRQWRNNNMSGVGIGDDSAWEGWLKELESPQLASFSFTRVGTVMRAFLKTLEAVRMNKMSDRDTHPMGSLIGQSKFLAQEGIDINNYAKNLIHYYVSKWPAVGILIWVFFCDFDFGFLMLLFPFLCCDFDFEFLMLLFPFLCFHFGFRIYI